MRKISDDIEKADFYNQQKTYYNEHAHSHLKYKEKSTYAENMIGRIIRLLKEPNHLRLLELGCGSGRFTIPLLKKGFIISAIDFSGVQINQLRLSTEEANINLGQLSSYCCNIEDLDKVLRNEKFDCILAFFLLHHLPDISSAFNIMKKFISEHGQLIFIEPNRWCPLYLLQIAFSKDMSWRYEKYKYKLALKKIKESLGKAGFASILMERFGLFPPQILDNFPAMLKVEKFIERLNLFNYFLPFLLINAKRE